MHTWKEIFSDTYIITNPHITHVNKEEVKTGREKRRERRKQQRKNQ